MQLSKRIVAAVLLVVGSSGAVYAFSKHGGWQMTPQEKGQFVTDRVTKELELSTAQRQNLESLVRLVADIVTEARADRTSKMGEIAELLDEASFNQARALGMVQRETGLVNEKAPLVISSLAIFLDSLDTRQKDKLRQFIEHRHQHSYGFDH